MADLTFIVDYKQLKAANQEQQKLGSTARQSAKIIEQAYKQVEREQRKQLSSLKQQMAFRTRMAKQREREEAKVIAATKRHGAEVERLKNKYIPMYAASKQYERAIEEINQAYSKGILTQAQYLTAMENLDIQMQVMKSTARGNQRGMNGLGVAMQQTGYQVGDFLVQVQSGTNPMVAFGQQATQLVGVLYLLPPVLLNGSVAIGALRISVQALILSLGIIIPLATAIGAAWMKTRKAAEDAAKGVDAFRDSLESAKSSISSMKFELEALLAGFEDVEEYALVRAMREAEEAASAVESTLERLMNLEQSTSSLGGPGPAGQIQALKEQLELEMEALEAARERVEEYRNSRDELKRIKSQQESLVASQETLKEGAQAFLNMWVSIKEAIEGAVDAIPVQALSDNEYQQMLYYQAYGESRTAAPSAPASRRSSGGSSGGSSAASEIEEATEALIDFDEATKNLVATQKLQQGIADNISTSFTNAYTSMIDGTKSVEDAFRDMARKIVQHLWEVFVVEQMVNSIGGGVMNLLGSAPTTSPRPIARSFSGGGYTGSGSRSGGLDGEGGFMAMLHPRETVVDHAKGQSMGDTIVVHQNFNLSANGDESIKRIISQEAPKIAQFTKASLLDDRRRGGKTKSTFG